MKKLLIGLVIGGIVASIFFNNYKVSLFSYNGSFKSENKTMYIYKDSNKVNHVDSKKQTFEIVVTNMNDYLND